MTTSVNMCRTLNAPAADVWEVVKDVEGFPSFMNEVQTVRILAHGDEHRTTAWSTELRGAVLRWTGSERVSDQDMTMAFEQVDGDLASFRGEWNVDARSDERADLRFCVEFEIGIPLLEDVLTSAAETAIRDNFDQMSRKIELHAQMHVGTEFSRRTEGSRREGPPDP